MISVQELISCLQERIQKYRVVQKGASRAREILLIGKQNIISVSQHLSVIISKQLEQLKLEAEERIITISSFCQRQLRKQRQVYQEETLQLRDEIAHQYKIINHLRQEMQDLMELLNLQKGCQLSNNQPSEQKDNYNSNMKDNGDERGHTVNGLEVIEQEETERTLISSVHSFTEEARYIPQDNFIRIQQKQKMNFEDENLNSDNRQGQLRHEEQQGDKKHMTDNSDEEEWPSHCKLQGSLQSDMASRQQAFQHDQLFQDVPIQWESTPVSCDYEGMRGQRNWLEGGSGNQLREITNESEHQRQKKTKMFLQQFRRTFNKCLSTNASRKNSKKDMSKPPKDKFRYVGGPFLKAENDKLTEASKVNDNQKMINDMLRDIDNNNKFSVGNRRSELKYEGERRDGVRSGHGILYYSNGLCYEGEFKNNLRHGFGVLKFNQIQIYRGEWAADQLSGQGKIRNFAVINKRKTQVSSSPLSRWVSYCGYFKGNRFEGEGTVYLQGGEKFFGKFICGCACGEGTLYKKTGDVQTGVWRHNQLVEQFKF